MSTNADHLDAADQRFRGTTIVSSEISYYRVFFQCKIVAAGAAIANIDDTIKSSKLKLELVTACSEWDKQNMFLSKGDK